MEKDKRNSNIFIVVLLVIIIVIGIILALKMTNIIKTKEEIKFLISFFVKTYYTPIHVSYWVSILLLLL